MERWFKRLRKSTLFRWIVFGCIALTIPIACAVINFFINKNLVERKINQVNEFMLRNLKYNVDTHLNRILETVNYYLLNADFPLYSFYGKDERRFYQQTQRCCRNMKLFRSVNPDTEVMLYLKDKDYIISSSTANEASYLYESLVLRGKTGLSLAKWESALCGGDRQDGHRSGFYLSDCMGYEASGRESLVYAVPMIDSRPGSSGYLVTSVSTDFISRLMENEANLGNTFLILDSKNRVLGQFGKKLELDSVPEGAGSPGAGFSFFTGGEKYIGARSDSDVAGWSYAVCMPQRLLMSDVNRNRNVNLLIVCMGAVVGVAAVIALQSRNYRPVKQLMDILPERDGDEESGADEFALVEYNLQKLYRENQSMSDFMEKRREYDRGTELFAAIKGRRKFSGKLTEAELLGTDYETKHFAFVTASLLQQEGAAGAIAIDRNLLSFVIDNVIAELLGEPYHYVKTMDEDTLVCLFLIELGGGEEWNRISMEKLQWLNEFFQNRLESDLTITIGPVFDTFERVESAYAEIAEADRQRYYTQPFGVVRSGDVETVDFSFAERMDYYVKRLGEAAFDADYASGKRVCGELFQELMLSGKSYPSILYYAMSVANHVLMVYRGLMPEGAEFEKNVDGVLEKLCGSRSSAALQDEFCHLLRVLCTNAGPEEHGLPELSVRIQSYVAEHYADCAVNISAIAGEIGITPRYMSRMFRQETGLNLLKYINDVRVEHARILLRTTDKTVEEIADETGFSSVRTFRRNFQKAANMTAADYRRTKA